MSVVYPLAALLLVPALVSGMWLWRHPASSARHMPADWSRLVEPALRVFMSTGTLPRSALGVPLMLAIWILLVAALARPAIELDVPDPHGNLAGRVITLDLGAEANVQTQRAAALALIEKMPAVPTALVVAAADAFIAVPLTTDRGFIERYLSVTDADVMPEPGRSVATALAYAEALLTRAGVAAGQVVILSAGEAPAPGAEGPPRWARALVVDASAREAWGHYSRHVDATLTDYDRLGPLDDEFLAVIDGTRRESHREGYFELAPFLLGAALVLWLGFFRRQRAA